MERKDLSPVLLRDLEARKVDVDFALSVLDRWNSGELQSIPKPEASGVPEIDGKRVLDMRGKSTLAVPKREALERLENLGLPPPRGMREEGTTLVFDHDSLKETGTALLDATAFGILNGGSATSFVDRKKNIAFDATAFSRYESHFERLLPLYRDKPKAVTPAYVNPDGSPGLSFLELKVRALLSLAATVKSPRRRPLPLFQMTSDSTDTQVKDAFDSMPGSPAVKPFLDKAGLDSFPVLTAKQPLTCAFTHSSEGKEKRVFDRANGKPDTGLALPGGHGMSFSVLSGIYGRLLSDGYRYAYLTNIDNLGALPDPVAVATLALSGGQAAFDFSFRTKMDVKGGILVTDRDGRFTCADIGPAISAEKVAELERNGARILFNCATGLFDLEWLVPRLGSIARNLPVRFSDQDKDAGKYSQGEQVTWEALSQFDECMIFAVEKDKRFLSAKLFMETLVASGAAGETADDGSEFAYAARMMEKGLSALLGSGYGLSLKGGIWQ